MMSSECEHDIIWDRYLSEDKTTHGYCKKCNMRFRNCYIWNTSGDTNE